MHVLLAIARRVHWLIFRRGLPLVPAILARYTMPCAWLLCLLCLGAAGYDLRRRRRFDAFRWIALALCLFAAFRPVAALSWPTLSLGLAVAAAALGLWLLAATLRPHLRRPSPEELPPDPSPDAAKPSTSAEAEGGTE